MGLAYGVGSLGACFGSGASRTTKARRELLAWRYSCASKAAEGRVGFRGAGGLDSNDRVRGGACSLAGECLPIFIWGANSDKGGLP